MPLKIKNIPSQYTPTFDVSHRHMHPHECRKNAKL